MELKQQATEQGAIVPATKDGAVATQLNSGLSYLAKHSSTGIPMRFNKEGNFILPTEGDKEVPEGTEFAVVWDQARAGFQRFGTKGEKPQFRLDLVFGGKPPNRDQLDDNDPSKWPVSDFSGEREDPWREVLMLPLQSTEDGQVYVFSTMSITGLRAVSNLLTQSARMASKDGDNYPVIKLRCGGYDHKKFGWVKVPAFERVGKAPKADITQAVTAIKDDMSDDIPW
jgi:hypothetical protein